MHFAIYFKQHPIQANLVSLMARHRKARPRGSLGCPSISFPIPRYSGIDPISARAADLLACPPHLLHKSCLSCSYHITPDLQPLGEDARHYDYVRCPKGLRLPALSLIGLSLTGSEMNSPIFSIGVTSALLSSDQGPIGKCRASCSVKAHSSSNNQISSSPT